jgi:hypothetical protein
MSNEWKYGTTENVQNGHGMIFSPNFSGNAKSYNKCFVAT